MKKIILLLALLFIAPFAHAASINISPSQDTYYGTVYYAGPNNTDTVMHYGGWGDAQYDYIQFSLSSIPAGSTINSATLYIYNQGASVNDDVSYASRITSSWSQATLTRTLNPTDDGVHWASMPSTAVSGLQSVSITSLVQDWYNGTYTNYGLKITPTQTSNQNNGTYSSSRGTNPEYLTVNYTPPSSFNFWQFFTF